jgi:glycosyltransferase involved in cell wall biosynthesis
VTPGPSSTVDGDGLRVLVVSHPSVLAVNQAVYLSMKRSGWNPLVVVPDRWRHEYAREPFPAQTLPGMEGSVRPLRVALAGRPQRHFYLTRPSALLQEWRPAAVFLEQESFSVPALQWGRAARRTGIPFGVQADENLDRELPRPATVIRDWVLRHADFVAARSPAAADLSERWGARGHIALVPHAVPEWPVPARSAGDDTFTVGFAGRLVQEKGVWDLVEATDGLGGPARLVFVGDGPLRSDLAAATSSARSVEIHAGVPHDSMAAEYTGMDVLVLPSRTTPQWAEQFGRVLVEALWCGVPVIGSDSGEIPWIISDTGGGVVYPEGDVAGLRRRLLELRNDPGLRCCLAAQGRAAVERRYTAAACGQTLGEVLARVVADRGRNLRSGERTH